VQDEFAVCEFLGGVPFDAGKRCIEMFAWRNFCKLGFTIPHEKQPPIWPLLRANASCAAQEAGAERASQFVDGMAGGADATRASRLAAGG
jgi:hypothetical protein